MSRCFPYPPPGYEKSAALIESIKLQKDRERAEKDRKKKEKKEKREKKSKSKSEEKNGKKKRHREDSSKSTLKKLTPEEEKSSLTEDHGGPATTQVPLYDSSDSTQDSTKKVHTVSEPASAPEQECRGTLNFNVPDAHASVVKIRLPLKLKQEESPTTSAQPCFLGRTTNQETIQQPQPSFSGRQPEQTTAVNEKKRKSKSSSSGGHGDVHRHYKKLVRDWNPPPLLPPEGDLDWLRGGSTARLCRAPPPPSAVVAGDGSFCRATYVPELGIHVLPYAVPF